MAQALHGKVIGDTARLAFEVSWPNETPAELAGLGWADVVLWFAGQRHWASGADGGDAERGPGAPVRWTWIDLVEHLGRSWPFLMHEENAPYGLVAEGPERLRDPRLLRSVDGRSEVEVEDAVHAFQHRHDLAAGLKGIWLPPVWLLREGRMARLRAAGQDMWIPVGDALGVLEAFVDEVLQHSAGGASARRMIAEKAWNEREPGAKLVWRLRTDLSWEDIADWTPEGQAPEDWWGDPLAENESPLMAAARLSSPLSKDTRRTIVRIVQGLTAGSTDTLDELAERALPVLEKVIDQKPYQQGYRLASWLRKTLDAGDGPVDPERILRRWGVHVADLPPNLDEAMDAMACWSEGKGPAVLVNPAGKHARSAGGRRATLAHEIAHLLVDRHRHLPLVEVFGGSTPLHLEQRARAFAAEFLLPRKVAARIVAGRETLDEAIEKLREEYGVSNEVAGWQIKNGPGWEQLDRKQQNQLDQWLPSWSSMIEGPAA